MKRFIAVLNDGSFININASRMEIAENSIIAWDGDEPVAFIDTGAVVVAHISERKEL